MKNFNVEDIDISDSSHTAKEIASQPRLWMETYKSLLKQKSQIISFLNKILEINNLQIILTGAGTSAFIGEILQKSFADNTGKAVKAIPTTDLVTHPADYFKRSIPTLLISFARSGDSPESLATVELAEQLHDVVYHLIITCNAEGQLTKTATNKRNALIFLLPEEANDQALAMTSSFTSMTLAGLLISDIKNIEEKEESVKKLIAFGKIILNDFAHELREVANMSFKRVVFLGSGVLKGTAKESQLKVIELTDGQIICQHDSFLGFRHGPKAVIDASTLLIYLFSNDPYVHNYEIDLVKSVFQTEEYLYSIGIRQSLSDVESSENLTISLCSEGNELSDDFFAICSIIPAQILGYYKSFVLGLTPDSPSQNGGIHRIVQGVTIYPYQNP
ncbi:MAG: SIS domain-containing protein [Bacteroidetes bacterium]|nr:SIS domain-containing protein [Bacteroidota bacterium]